MADNAEFMDEEVSFGTIDLTTFTAYMLEGASPMIQVLQLHGSEYYETCPHKQLSTFVYYILSVFLS